MVSGCKGEFVCNKRHGHGILEFKDPEKFQDRSTLTTKKYEGAFADDEMWGFGRLLRRDGTSENAYPRGPSVFCLCGKDMTLRWSKLSSFFQCTSRDRFSSICSPCAAVLPKPDGFPFSLVEPFSTSRRSAPRSPYLHCGSDLHYLPLSRGPVALHLTTS